MALDTSKDLRNKVMYQVFVRNFSEEGTFARVEEALPRIKSLGADIIWLMPVHPIGEKKRKGTLGSPYAISDYRSINPEFGTLDDFIRLTNAIHDTGMKCIIDVVYNHTSPDSVLSREHPEWFYHDKNGSFGNRVGDWSDIIDLDYNNKELWDYQIDTLKYWAKYVDGFRCDVAPLIPIEFWLKAREEVAKVRPDCIWLSESVEPGFILYMRSRGMTALSDSEIFGAFDISYEYDCYKSFCDFLKEGSLEEYVKDINRQEYIYPDNYVKLRFLENHDVPRAAFLIPDEKILKNLTAFMFFQKGTALVYNGQEYGKSHLPGLFDKDTIEWDSGEMTDLSPLISKLAKIKRMSVFTDSTYEVRNVRDEFIVASHTHSDRKAVGVFAVKNVSGVVPVELNDGVYTDLISGKKTEIARGMLRSQGEPIILY